MSRLPDPEEQRPDPPPDRRAGARPDRGAAARARHQETWVDLQVRRAVERGDFDRLPGAGKPIEDLGSQHDPDWWLRKLVERERVVVLPLTVQLRHEDAALDERLDGLHREEDVRRVLEDFNSRVVAARYRLPEGPPLITMPRDVEEAVSAWARRRADRLAATRARLDASGAPARSPRRGRPWWRPWWRRVGRPGEGPA